MFGQCSCLCCFSYPPAQQKLYRSRDETLIGAGFTLLCGRLMLIFPTKQSSATRCCCNEDKGTSPNKHSRTCSLAPLLLINYLQCFSLFITARVWDTATVLGVSEEVWGGEGSSRPGLVHWESCNIVRLCYNWWSSTVWVWWTQTGLQRAATIYAFHLFMQSSCQRCCCSLMLGEKVMEWTKKEKEE